VLAGSRTERVQRHHLGKFFLKALKAFGDTSGKESRFHPGFIASQRRSADVFPEMAATILSLDQLMEEIGFEPIDPQTLEAERLEAERSFGNTMTSSQSGRRYWHSDQISGVSCCEHFERKGVKEIARFFNKKEGTVKSLLSRGIGKLKNLM